MLINLGCPILTSLLILTKKGTKEEDEVSKFLWRISGAESEEIFKTCYGSMGTRANFENLQSRCNVSNIVIDCWALVLTYYEARRTKGLLKRLFSSTSVLTGNSTSDHNLDALFKRNVPRMVNGDHTLFDLASFDLIFFHILSLYYYYFYVSI